MEVNYKDNQLRMADRIKLPAQVMIGDKKRDVLDWSFAGFAIANTDIEFKTDAVLDVVMFLPFAHHTSQCNMQAEVRFINDKILGFEFHDIPHSVRLLMREYVEEYIEGRLHGEESSGPAALPTTQAIDSNSIPQQQATFKFKFIQYAALSLALVIAIAIILLSQRYVNSTQAGLVGNTAEIRTRADGYVKQVLIKPGDSVSPGQLVVTLDDREARRNLHAGAFVQQRLEASVTAAEQSLHAERANDKLYSRIAGWRNAAEQARVAETDAMLAQATAELKRTEELHRSGFVSKSNLDDRRIAYEQNVAGLNRVKAEASLAVDVARGAKDGRFFSSTQVANRTSEVMHNLEKQKAELAQAIVQLGPLFSAVEYTNINAPMTGKVRMVNRVPGELVRTGDLVAMIETATTPFVMAKFSVNDAFRIGPGQKCRVFFPALDLMLEGEVDAVGPQGLVIPGTSTNAVEPAQSEVPVSIRLANAPALAGGLHARVEIDTHQNVWTLMRQRLQ